MDNNHLPVISWPIELIVPVWFSEIWWLRPCIFSDLELGSECFLFQDGPADSEVPLNDLLALSSCADNFLGDVIFPKTSLLPFPSFAFNLSCPFKKPVGLLVGPSLLFFFLFFLDLFLDTTSSCSSTEASLEVRFVTDAGLIPSLAAGWNRRKVSFWSQ